MASIPPCSSKEVVLLAIYPEQKTGVPTSNIMTSDGVYDGNLHELNKRMEGCKLVSCEQVGPMTEAGYCYVLYTFEK